MENQVKVNLWIEELEKKNKTYSLTNFIFNEKNTLRMTNAQYDEVFSLLIQGYSLKIGNLDLINNTLSQALEEKSFEDKQSKNVHIYTDEDQNIQKQKLQNLVAKKEQMYLTFGLLDYFDNNQMHIKSAPLVLMPIRIERLQNGDFQVSSINHELFLNDSLISKLFRTRRIDLSYPLENNFSLIEYFTYVSVKVRNYHFSVNNGCFITNLNPHMYYNYQDFVTHQKEISELPLVKSISYLNSEFFNLNKSTSARLNNQYLSLLDLDNEEYRILKTINQRENIVLRTNSSENKEHILTNILFDFLLNNKKILITYDEKSFKEISNFINNSFFKQYSLNLDPQTINKDSIIKHLLKKDKLDFDAKLLDQVRINETIDNYYLLKNNFKKIINSLRKNNEPMNLSINRAIIGYYSLEEYPLIDITIPNVDLLDQKKLNEYLSAISSFTEALDTLKCHYLDHPFYGFNNLTLNQAQYQELKEKIILLSNEFEPSKTAFQALSKKYGFPHPHNLKEMKCILNLISILPSCIKISPFLYEIENFDSVFQQLSTHNQLFNELNILQNKIISLYGDKVFLIDHQQLNKRVTNKSLNRKAFHFYRQFFIKTVKIDEEILTNVSLALNEYYELKDKIEAIINNHLDFKDFYHEGMYSIEELNKQVTIVKNFLDNCNYLNKDTVLFSQKNLSNFTEEQLNSLPSDRKKCQIAFNHLLKHVNYLKTFFDEDQINFSITNFDILEDKITKAGKNFVAINDYLNFILSLKKLNTLIPSLGNELLKHHQKNSYSYMFMKCFYQSYALSFINNNPLFKNYDMDNFMNTLDNYQDYDATRLEIIDALVKNNLKANVQKNSLALRSLEIPYLNTLNSSSIKVLPLERFINQTKMSIHSSFPIILIPVQEVSSLLYQSDINFDVNIVLAHDDLLSVNMLPSMVRSHQTIVLDSNLINHDNDQLIYQNNEHFVYSALQTLNVINYISSSYKENILKANIIDVDLKNYLIKKLTSKDFQVGKDISTPYGTIDILVKVKNSARPTAIIIDHLSYYSIESSISAFKKAAENLETLGYANYRIISALYFANEEQEFDKLMDFIITNTIQEKNIQKVSKKKPLVDVIFNEYLEPEKVYLKILDRDMKSNEDILIELLKSTAPILKDQVLQIIGSEGMVTLTDLQVKKKISINNNFVFLNDNPIEFKRVNKEQKIIRTLDTVANEEIAQGVLKILTHKDFYIDEIIKLILLTLGYQKMNSQHYSKIQNIISDLVEDNKISQKDNVLHFESNK